MATASKKTTPTATTAVIRREAVSSTAVTDRTDDRQSKKTAAFIRTEPSSNATNKGIQTLTRAQTKHPLEPLSPAEISVAVATVRAAGATPEVRDSMRFIDVVLMEPDKHIVALADAYFFPPFQSSLLPRTKGGHVHSKLPPRQARLVVYSKKSNDTSVWIVELVEVHATT